MGEAFMVRTHPQWMRAIELVLAGRIGQLRYAMGCFGYYNVNPENIRNVAEYGGGALMDIGCYPIKTSRMVFGEEPVRVCGTLVRDRAFDTDILTSAILEYPSGHCVFTCSTQIAGQQSMRFFGTQGRIETEIPFNATPGGISRVIMDDCRDFLGGGTLSVEQACAIVRGLTPAEFLEEVDKLNQEYRTQGRGGSSSRGGRATSSCTACSRRPSSMP